MGKWATYRRKGSTRPAAPALPLPPEGYLDGAGDDFLYFPESADNTAGTVELYFALTVGGSYTFVQSFPWADPTIVGDTGAVPPGWYKALTIGNGITYGGTGPLSTPWQIE